jgi:hypothetical protein
MYTFLIFNPCQTHVIYLGYVNNDVAIRGYAWKSSGVWKKKKFGKLYFCTVNFEAIIQYK